MKAKKWLLSAKGAKQYFERELGAEEYYGKTPGWWIGKGRELLGLSEEVSKEAFGRLVDNLHPVTGKRLSRRTNTTRKEIGWEVDEVTGKWNQVEREVASRRIGPDMVFPWPKGASVYYELTKDRNILDAALEAHGEMKYGYARISLNDPNPAVQIGALRRAGCEKIFTDKVSGTTTKRPELERCLSVLQKGRHAGGLETRPAGAQRE